MFTACREGQAFVRRCCVEKRPQGFVGQSDTVDLTDKTIFSLCFWVGMTRRTFMSSRTSLAERHFEFFCQSPKES